MLPRPLVAAAVAALILTARLLPTGHAAEIDLPIQESTLYLETDRDAAKLLEAARKAVRARDWREALRAYQRLIDAAGKEGAQALLPSPADPAVHLRVQDVAALELARLPREAIEVYRTAHDASARELFEPALAARDAGRLTEVARRYLASSWGDDALAALGAIAFSRADYVAAVAAWQRLLELCPEPTVSLASIRARMWVALRALGRERDAASLARRLLQQHGEESLTLGGQEIHLADFLRQPLTLPTPRPVADWPMLGGGAAHSRLPRGIEELGEARWTFSLPSAVLNDTSRREFEQRGLVMPFVHHVTSTDGRVFAVNDGALYAADLATGRVAWAYPDAPKPPRDVALDETIHAAAVADGRVFVGLADGVAAFDASTGRLLWHYAFEERGEPPNEPAKEEAGRDAEGRDEREEAAQLGSKVTMLATPPVAGGGKVVFGLTHLGDEARASVVALDARSGQPVWRAFICSRSVAAFLSMGALGSPPAIDGGAVYYSTNLGAVASLDLATGAIRWVRRYAAFRGRLRQSIIERHGRWANNPPIVRGGRVFVAPQDAPSLIALDAIDGSEVWSAPRAGGRYLVGAEGLRLFFVGRSAVAVDVGTGKRVWATAIPVTLAGRPALCPGRLFIPTADRLLAARTEDGRLATCRLWEADERPGNIALIADCLVVASYDRVHAFDDWSETRRRLAARQEAEPGDPAVPLAFGRHQMHRGDAGAAVGYFEAALRLASAKPAPEAVKLARRRLFEAYRAIGDARALGKALACAPDARAEAETLHALARLHEESGRWAEAIAAYQAVLNAGSAVRLRTRGGLLVSDKALAAAEIARLIQQHGREAYVAQEAAAKHKLAEAEGADDLEAVVRRFPNSAAAEEALLRRLEQPDAEAMAPELTALYHSLAGEPASDARARVAATLNAWRQAARASHPPVARRWQVYTRIAHRRVERFDVPRLPEGFAFFATDRRSFARALPFDALECRRPETGRLVWQRDLGEWDRLGVVAGGRLILATFDHLIALDPASGALRWAYSLADDAPAAEGGLVPPDGVLRPRRNERRRVVALAASDDAVFAALAGGKVFALSGADGGRRWMRELDAVFLLERGLFAVGDQLWVCAEHPSAVVALDQKEGRDGGHVALAGPDQRITDRPAFDASNGRLYLVLGDRSVHALDLRAGRELWRSSVDFGISRVLLDRDGSHCYVLPDSFAPDVQILSLDPASGEVRRRRSLRTGALADAATAPGVLYLAEKDADHDLVVQALDPDDLGARWQTVPLRLFRPSPLVVGAGLLAVTGSHERRPVGVLIDAATGKVAGDVRPGGASRLSASFVGDLLCLGTNRGIHAYGPTPRGLLDRRIALLATRLDRGAGAAAGPLANALYQRGDEQQAVAVLARALTDESLSDEAYAALKDQLNSVREAMAERRPPVIVARRFDTPPNIDGAVDEPWRPDQAAALNSPAHIEEIQGLPAGQTRWRSPSDLSAVLYTGWDDEYFYFAIDVTDDIHRTYTSQRETWVGDGLIISIDCDNDGGYGYSFTGRDLLLTLALTRKDERRDDEDGEEPKGAYRVRRKDDNSGTVYEVAIPWSYMKMAPPRPGFRFGFNVTVTDDDGERTTKAVSWTPGMILDRDRDLMIRGFTPAFFGDVLIDGPPGSPSLLKPPLVPDRSPRHPRPDR